MIKGLASYLKNGVLDNLPGERAHVEIAPIHRPLAEEAKKWEDTKFSGVLVFLYPHNNRIHLALMKRPEYGGVHGGQVSFPGGKREEKDKNIQQTAIREAEEELGILADNIEIIGSLSELYIPPSKSLVTPILAYSEKRPDFIIDEHEVEALIEADLFEMFKEKYFNRTEIVTSKYLLKEVPAILYKGYTIWGATAMILNEFKWVLKDFSQIDK